jgi:hypothetical protein
MRRSAIINIVINSSLKDSAFTKFNYYSSKRELFSFSILVDIWEV